jgi:hypothetical protein
MDYVVVINDGAVIRTNNSITTDKTKVFGDQGAVRVVLGGVEYVWGVNDSKTLPSNLAAEAVAADSRLRIRDSRDGDKTART